MEMEFFQQISSLENNKKATNYGSPKESFQLGFELEAPLD